MNRTVVYLTNEHPFYLRMLYNSIEMLVRNLKTPVNIKVFLIRDDSKMTIDRGSTSRCDGYEATAERIALLHDLGVEVLERRPLKVEGEESFFHAQRVWLRMIDSPSVLYMDSDTFVFGDVNDLFDKYEDLDFVAVEAEWVKGRGFPRDVFHESVRPFSSGVMLWNNNWHWDWANQLKDWMSMFRLRQHALSEWLYKQHDDCLLREEFSATAWVNYRHPDLKFGYFDSSEVQLIRYSSDIDNLGKQTIFHSYTPNWKACYNRLVGVSLPKVPKMRLNKNGHT